MGLIAEAIQQTSPTPDYDPSLPIKLAILTVIAALITPTWLSWWNARVARKEMRPNGGQSMKDQVTRIDANLEINTAINKVHAAQITELQLKQRNTHDTMRQIQEDVAELKLFQQQRREIITAEQEEIK